MLAVCPCSHNEYDVWGNPTSPGMLLNNDNGVFIIARFTGHQYDTVIDVYFAEARFLDAKNRQWLSSDPMKDGLNWYQYVGSNPATFVDPWGLERIVISGGYYGNNPGYQYEFIDSALKEIISYRGKEKSTLLIASVGVTKEDINRISKLANTYNFNVIYFTNAKELNDYINNGSNNDRADDPITRLLVFSHGYAGSIEFGHGVGLSAQDKESLSWTIDIIKLLDPTAFKNAYFAFFSCNTGTEKGGISFAQEWSNITGGITRAVIGPTWYGNINSPVWWNIDGWITHRSVRDLGGGYSLPYPAFSPPRLGDGGKWVTFFPETHVFPDILPSR